MIWLIISGVIGMLILAFALSIIYVYVKSNHVIDDMILPYNDYVVLKDGHIRHVYRVMDIKMMRQKGTLEAVYPDNLDIVEYHGFLDAPEHIEKNCQDDPLPNSQMVVIVNSIRNGSENNDRH